MMGKVFIYMNEKIRQTKPKGPVIRVQAATHAPDSCNFQEGNMVIINGPSIVRFDPRGLPIAEGHNVKAWIEADMRDVVIR